MQDFCVGRASCDLTTYASWVAWVYRVFVLRHAFVSC
jgi:hypothetical protein